MKAPDRPTGLSSSRLLTVHARLCRAAGRRLTGMQSPGKFIRVISKSADCFIPGHDSARPFVSGIQIHNTAATRNARLVTTSAPPRP